MSRLRFVAATMRTLTSTLRTPPTRKNVRVSIARDNFRHGGLALDLRPQSLIVNAQVSLFGSLPDAHIELVDAIRLGEVIIRAELHRFDRGLDRTLAGQHDYFRGVRAFVYAPQQLH